MFHGASIALSDIHKFFTNVIDEIEVKGAADLKALSTDIQTALSAAKVEALKEVAAVAPDVQAAVQKAINELEQAVLAAIAAKIG